MLVLETSVFGRASSNLAISTNVNVAKLADAAVSSTADPNTVVKVRILPLTLSRYDVKAAMGNLKFLAERRLSSSLSNGTIDTHLNL